MAKKNDGMVIAEPNLVRAAFKVYGTAPYVQHKFGKKTRDQMLQAQMATKATSRKKNA